MTHRRSRWMFALALVAMAFAGAPAAFGQATSGTLAGRVVIGSDGSPLPGAQIAATHLPTGTHYAAVTQGDGYFAIPNARVGGPYEVLVTMDGFKENRMAEVMVRLGAETNLTFQLQLTSVEEVVTVTGSADPLINSDRTGSGSAISTEQLESLPTVRRSFQDFARTNAYFNVDAGDAASTRLVVAGRNNRYNTIQIDGAVNNDLFGLADTGTPGGSADTQPISLDAVQELQLVVSPYDVRQSGFTGGGINAITRSGANDFHGSVYGSTRDEDFVGERSDLPEGRQDYPTFEEDQYGARLGGRIIPDRLFFFVSAETNSNDTPTGFSADGQAAAQFSKPELAQAVRDTLINQYGFDPGGLEEFVEGTNSDLIMAKLDWNVGSNHSFALRHNFVDAQKDRIEAGERNSTSRFSFPSYYYDFTSETNSTVAQLNSTIGTSLFNEARVGFQTIRDNRNEPTPFPDVQITDAGLRVNGGVSRFSHANALDQDILEITDDLTWLTGDHTISIGTHNELFTFDNLFLDAAYGFYGFSSLADFQSGKASSYAVGFSNTDEDSVKFDVRQYGIYAGDQWRLSDKFTVYAGIRLDVPTFPDSPSRNVLLDEQLGIDTSDSPDRMMMWQPRIGFNWRVNDDQQVRGGVGIFAGRTPYVWMSNNYQNSGVEFSNLSVSGANTPHFDPYAPPPHSGASFLPRIDAIDPDFEFPQVMRATLAYDVELPGGIETTLETLYSRSIEDVHYTNENLAVAGTLPDGRPRYARESALIDAVYYMQNNDEGREFNVSLQARKRFQSGLDFRAQYAYGDAQSMADLTSSRAVSNFRFSPQVDSVHPESTTTFFEQKHRGVASASYNFMTGPLGHSVGLYYSVMSGAPYSYLYSNDVNFDNVGQAGNDPLYVPRDASEVDLPTTGNNQLTWAELDSYISNDRCLDEHRGQIVDRNACYSPYTRQLDFHYGIELPIKVLSTELTFDILNLMNLIDSDKGVYRTVPFGTISPIAGSVSSDGRWSYRKASAAAFSETNRYPIGDLRSRWQAKIGLRLSF